VTVAVMHIAASTVPAKVHSALARCMNVCDICRETSAHAKCVATSQSWNYPVITRQGQVSL